MALWATHMAWRRNGFGETLGREVTEDDIEPVNWVQAEYAAQLSAVDYATALAAAYAFRRERAAAGGSATAGTCCSRRRSPSRRRRCRSSIHEPRDPSAPMRRAGQFVPFTPAFNMSGQPAISLPLHWNADGLPIGVQLVAAYGREDVLVRVASQLEAAHPWADRRPPV